MAVVDFLGDILGGGTTKEPPGDADPTAEVTERARSSPWRRAAEALGYEPV